MNNDLRSKVIKLSGINDLRSPTYVTIHHKEALKLAKPILRYYPLNLIENNRKQDFEALSVTSEYAQDGGWDCCC